MASGGAADGSYSCQREHMRTHFVKSNDSTYQCKHCGTTWKTMNQTKMVKHFNMKHDAHILASDQYGNKRQRVSTTPEDGRTANTDKRVSIANQNARDPLTAFSLLSFQVTAISDEAISTLNAFNTKMKTTIQAIKL
jgi:hypothetical protein